MTQRVSRGVVAHMVERVLRVHEVQEGCDSLHLKLAACIMLPDST